MHVIYGPKYEGKFYEFFLEIFVLILSESVLPYRHKISIG